MIDKGNDYDKQHKKSTLKALIVDYVVISQDIIQCLDNNVDQFYKLKINGTLKKYNRECLDDIFSKAFPENNAILFDYLSNFSNSLTLIEFHRKYLEI